MIAEKTNTSKTLTDFLSKNSGKVSFLSNEDLANALSYLEKHGLPTNKHEDYKYCNLEAVIRKEFSALKESTFNSISFNEFKRADCINLFVVNGNFEPSAGDSINEVGISASKLSEVTSENKKKISSIADPTSDSFIALNTAYSGDGLYLKIEKNVIIKKTVRIVYISTASSISFINPRNFIEVGAGSQLDLIEEQINHSQQKIFSNYLSEKFIDVSARLNSTTIQDEKLNSYAVNTNQILVKEKGYYHNTTVTLSGTLVRNNHNVIMDGEYCETHLNGLFITMNDQLVDNHTLMDHRKPNCQSNELYKGVVKDKSTGIFNGKIFVRKDAQKTNAYQSSKNILLSDDATINTKPQLEIYADDVKCSHGTSTGKIDEEAMFYLNARGINKENANKLLLNAFASEVLEKIENKKLIEELEMKLGLSD